MDSNCRNCGAPHEPGKMRCGFCLTMHAKVPTPAPEGQTRLDILYGWSYIKPEIVVNLTRSQA